VGKWDDGDSLFRWQNDDNKRLIGPGREPQQGGHIGGNEIEACGRQGHSAGGAHQECAQELMQTQALFQARVHESRRTEEHITKVSEREEGRLNQEIRRLDKEEISNSKATKNQLENNIFKQTAQLEEMKAQMNWNQQALEAWLEESEKKTEDSLALQKYTRQDEGKIRELRPATGAPNGRAQRQEGAPGTHHPAVGRNHQSEWRHATEEIELLAAQRPGPSRFGREKEELIKEKQNFLDSEKGQQYRDGEDASANAGKIRLEYQEAEVQRANFQNELDSLKRTVDRTNKDLELARSDINASEVETAAKKTKLEVTVQEERAGLEDHLKRVQNDRLSAEQQAANMDELMKSEEVGQKEMEKELKDSAAPSSCTTPRPKSGCPRPPSWATGPRLRNLNAKIAKLDHDLFEAARDSVQNQDFSIQQLQRRISRMSGETNSDEKVALEARIKELNADLDQRVQVATTLSGQLRQLQDENQALQARHGQDQTGERRSSALKIEELSLHNDNSTRESRPNRAGAPERHDENFDAGCATQLNNRADRVMSEDKRKLQFETAMKERRAKRSAFTRRCSRRRFDPADDERQQGVSSELHEREAKIDKLQKRYEIIMVSMAPPEGEEERSQAYLRHQGCHRTGEELQRRRRPTRRPDPQECRALENTLRLMNSCNENYRQTFSKVGPTSDEAAQREQLDQQIGRSRDKLSGGRFREMEEELQTMQEALENLAKDDALYREQVGQLEQLVGQREARERVRASANLNGADKAIARAKGPLGGRPIEADIGLRELREFNRARRFRGAARRPVDWRRGGSTAPRATCSRAEWPLPTTGTAWPAAAPGRGRPPVRAPVAASRSSAASVASRARLRQPEAAVAAVPGRVNIGTELRRKSPPGSQPMSRRSSTSSTAAGSVGQ
uniref:Coiled-coil domain-containing protein 39 n=1 Tax=Macrostomum lignano TaxID=282301 RepID=A0A1I8FEI2_9PLAT